MIDDGADIFDALPGGLMIWVLIISELLVFGAGLVSFLSVRIIDQAGFVAAQSLLHSGWAGINTVVLVTSGLFAAQAVKASAGKKRRTTQLWLAGALALGLVFLAIKGTEFVSLAGLGISTETHVFFTFYYLLTGFHAAHVAAGIIVFALVTYSCRHDTVEAAAAFWHMVDLVWVLIFPIIYLLP